MNPFEKALAGSIGAEQLRKIQGVRVGIAGAGGLGSNCAQFLVRSGFKKLIIADFDRVEWSNLNRQFYFPDQVGMKKVDALRVNLERINPDLELVTLDRAITTENAKSVFKGCDILVEALDGARDKRMLVEKYLDSGMFLVCASGMAGWGNSDGIIIKKIKDGLYLVGDMISEAGPGLPPLAPRVNVVAAKEADIVLSYVLNPPGGEGDGN